MSKMSEPMKSLQEAKAKKAFKRKLVDARKAIENPKRGGNNEFKKYKYVTLQDLYDAVIPALLDEGLMVRNFKDFVNERLVLKTVIEDCDSDETIETFGVLNENLKIQDHGGELTYHSRYNLGCLLSIRTDYDDDAQSIKDIKPSEIINDFQSKQIKKLINGSKSIGQLIRDNFGYEKLSDIRKEDYQNIVLFIERRLVGEVKNGEGI